MKAIAYVRDDILLRGVQIAVSPDGERVRAFGPTTDLLEVADGCEPDRAAWLHLRMDEARALYEALAEHFGHAGHDIRNLRQDYNAERARVDRLIGAVIDK